MSALGVVRFNPNPDSTIKPDPINALQQLQEKIALRKLEKQRNLESEASEPQAINDEPASQSELYDAHVQDKKVAKAPAKKTKSKQNYLKRKLDRRKARLRAEKSGKDGDAQDVDKTAMSVYEVQDLTPEERRAAKRAKREARRAGATENATDEQQEAVEEQSGNLLGPSKDQEMGTETVEDEEYSRKELNMLAQLEKVKKAQMKLVKKAKKENQKRKYQEIDNTQEAVDEERPTLEGALPRFPATSNPLPPSSKDLESLRVANELKTSSVHVIPSTATGDDNTNLDRFVYSSGRPILTTQILERLKEFNILSLFPVQQQVIQALIPERPITKRDLCVSAPTGSGKTLSYILPIVQVSCPLVSRLHLQCDASRNCQNVSSRACVL